MNVIFTGSEITVHGNYNNSYAIGKNNGNYFHPLHVRESFCAIFKVHKVECFTFASLRSIKLNGIFLK